MSRYRSLNLRQCPYVFAALALASLTRIDGRTGGVDDPRRLASTAIFEQNVGQFAGDIKFAASGQSRRPVAVTERGGLQVLVASDTNARSAARIDIDPVDSRPAPAIQAVDALPFKVHRFHGSNPALWKQNIPTSSRVRVEELYTGIDLEYYGTEREIEYDFILSPGANPDLIRLNIAGAEVRRDEYGGLIYRTPAGDLRQRPAVAYQYVAGERRLVPAEYRIAGAAIGFSLGEYDRSLPLVIDPILVVSTFRGGSRADSGRAVAFGSDGLYVAGIADRGFVDAGNVDHSDLDTFVAKYSIDGRTLNFVTYYGGSQAGPALEKTDEPVAIAVDLDGMMYVAGNTRTIDLPIAGSAMQTTLSNMTSGFLFRLSADGSSLLLSTYLGAGPQQRPVVTDMALAGDLYLVGQSSLGGVSVPAGPGDGWLLRMTRGGVPVAGRRVGGEPAAVAVASNGAVIVAGTEGWATPGAFQTTHGNSTCSDSFRTSRACRDANVARFSAESFTLEWATFLRETMVQPSHAEEKIGDVAIDVTGAVYVSGWTLSASFPITPGAYQPACGFCNPNTPTTGSAGTGFVTKLNSTGSALEFSTFLGASSDSSQSTLVVDRAGHVFVAGTGIVPAVGPPMPGASTGTAFVVQLNATGTSALYSSRFGGTSGFDVPRGLALSPFGSVAITGATQSSDFPEVDAVQPTYGGAGDGFVSLISVPRIVTVLESPVHGGTTRASAMTLRGFAADTRAVGNSGIDGVHLYAYPNGGGTPLFLGLAMTSESRPDVAAALGADFAMSGFSLTTTLAPGDYLFVAYAHSDVTGTFGDPAKAGARALAGAQLDLLTPTPGPSNQGFEVSGTAVDLSAPSGTGIDTVHVWAYPNPGSGAPARFLGVANYGEPRPELDVAYGARFRNSGFSLDATLEPGLWLVVAYGRSTVSQTFSVHDTVAITVAASQPEIHFEAPLGPVVYSGFQINGWARDARSLSGGGFDAIHAWAYPNPGSGAAPVFLGATTTAHGRPDVANTHGLQFLLTGFVIRTAPLTAGTYLVVVFARSTVSGRFEVNQSRMLEVRVATEAVLQLETPTNGSVVGPLIGATGYAFDPRSVGHLGVDGVHVWLYPNWGSGQAPVFVGLAFQGLDAPDIGSMFGLNFSKTRFGLSINLPGGAGSQHLIAVFAHSIVTGEYTVRTAIVTRQ
jgi:hypothetical protein